MAEAGNAENASQSPRMENERRNAASEVEPGLESTEHDGADQASDYIISVSGKQRSADYYLVGAGCRAKEEYDDFCHQCRR